MTGYHVTKGNINSKKDVCGGLCVWRELWQAEEWQKIEGGEIYKVNYQRPWEFASEEEIENIKKL